MTPVDVEARADGVIVVAPAGRLTIGPGLAELGDAVASACRRPRPRVVVDLAAVTYVDSAALGELVAARRRVAAAGGAFALARPRGKVRDLLDLTRLHELLTIRDSLGEASRSVLAAS